MSKKTWQEWLESLPEEEQLTIAKYAVERLMEIEEVSFRQHSDDDDDGPECLFWSSCGEDLRTPF